MLTWRTLRRLLLAILLLLVAWSIWRGARLAAATYAAAEAAQQLQAAMPAVPATTAGPAADVPRLRAGLALLDGRLEALAAELAPLAPALRFLGGLSNAGLDVIPGQVALAQQLADAAAALGPHLDWLLGMDAPRRFLLLVQNNHELRATGGFISAFGYLVLDQGRIASLDFVDSYELFSLQSEYPPAPEPMEQYMGIELLVARDTNWSPDLPTAAAEIVRLYTQDSGRAVDGILTLDLHAVRLLAGALGSLRVPGVDTPLTAANLEAELVRLWEQPLTAGENDEETGGAAGDWWSRRKDFVPLVAGAIFERIQGGAVDAPALAAAVGEALNSRSLQLWLDQPQLQSVLAAQGWDGGLHPLPGADFLAVVDSNVGYNKVDAAMQRRLDYSVTWPDGPDAGAQAVLWLTYTHPIQASDPGCDPAPRYGDRYADLIARCYFDYVRVYTPAGSRLVDVDGIAPESVTSRAGEAGTQQFAGYLVVKPGDVRTVTFTYRLPAAITPDAYDLLIQRQAGTGPLPLRVTVAGVEKTAQLAQGAWRWQ